MKLQSKWFQLVKEGKKTVEGRLGNRQIDVGPHAFTCEDDMVDVIIDSIIFYDTFEHMLHDTLKDALPNHTLEEGIEIYNEIYGDRLEKKEPVMCIRFHLI